MQKAGFLITRLILYPAGSNDSLNIIGSIGHLNWTFMNPNRMYRKNRIGLSQIFTSFKSALFQYRFQPWAGVLCSCCILYSMDFKYLFCGAPSCPETEQIRTKFYSDVTVSSLSKFIHIIQV